MYKNYIALLICCCCIGSMAEAENLPEATTSLGTFRGTFGRSYQNKTYMQFRGLPYALPPIDDLRFADPVEFTKKFSEPYIANKSSICIQVDHVADPPGGINMGTEDCLNLNVYVPGNKINRTRNLDVAINFHGGAFVYGWPDMALPQFIMDRDIIMVTVAYRLGVMGFLSTGDKNLPGNLGMKDQTMAIRWVNKHIGSFGGNKNSIMLAGLSAGGASVHFHYFSPLSRGLFQSGISHSGCALNSWTIQEEPLKNARKIGRVVGCNQESTKALVACLKKVPALNLTDSIRVLRPWKFNPFSPVAPVVDDSSPNPFLPEHPYKMLKEGNVMDAPWILSATTSEGLYPGAEFILNNSLIELENNWHEYAPAILHYMDTIPEDRQNEVSDMIKQYYLADQPISNATFLYLMQMIGDRLFTADEELAARMQANVTESEVYFYHYDYMAEARHSLVFLFTGLREKYGVSHGDDVCMMMATGFERNGIAPLTPRDENMKDDLVDIWTSFASTGVPSPNNWEPVRKHVDNPFRYMYVGRDGKFEMHQSRDIAHRGFWESLGFSENSRLFCDMKEEEDVMFIPYIIN